MKKRNLNHDVVDMFMDKVRSKLQVLDLSSMLVNINLFPPVSP